MLLYSLNRLAAWQSGLIDSSLYNGLIWTRFDIIFCSLNNLNTGDCGNEAGYLTISDPTDAPHQWRWADGWEAVEWDVTLSRFTLDKIE